MQGGVAALAALVAVGAGATAPSADAAVECDLYAHPNGSDFSSGSADAPVRSAQRLVGMLSAGQTGCLKGGLVFDGDLRITSAGEAGNPITIRSEPDGPRATVRGRVIVTETARDVVVSDLVLDGSQIGDLTSPYVYGERITFANNDVSNGHRGKSCFLIGSTSYVAEDIALYGNRIHNCGQLPATNLDHGIYLLSSRNAVIENNYIYRNSDWGVHLYPDADGTRVTNNVIDSNGSGVIFAGEGSRASSDNVVSKNIITNSLIKREVEIYWGSAVGTGNVVNDNCVYGDGSQFAREYGYRQYDNKTVDPQYSDASSGDYRLSEESPCLGYGPNTAQPAPPASAGPGATAATGPTCAGREATIVGTRGRDVLRGTRRADVIAAGAGNDVVLGGGGADIICGGSGNDRLSGGSSNDRVYGGSGRDRVFGQSGRDVLNGGPGRDVVAGQGGRDRVLGGTGNDRLLGGSGRDVLLGGGGNDRIFGGPGRDVANGQRGRDLLNGGTGSDRLSGGPGRDIAQGAAGVDRCDTERRFSCERG